LRRRTSSKSLLAKEGLRREDMGREKFEERVWQWKAESGGMITHQQRQLGESVNWDMERFTMDEGLSHIVRRVFVQLYNEGLIYRGERMINWCPKDQTALSNIEVEHKEVNGHLYYVRYPLEGAEHDGNKYLLVATTRPETILGDEALAVHPEDERYAHFKGAKAKVPFINKLIPIVFDDSVDKDFGTGVVKVTPAHDFNDFATGTRHKLPFTNIMTESAHMNDLAGPYKGLSREACRKKIVEDLEASEMIEKIDSHKQSVGHSYRSGAVVEPRLSLAVVRQSSPARQQSSQRGHFRRDTILPQALGKPVLRLDAKDRRLVHQPPTVVGPPSASVVLHRLRRRHRQHHRCHRMFALQIEKHQTRQRRARYVVLIGAVAVLDAHAAADCGHRRDLAILTHEWGRCQRRRGLRAPQESTLG
jgi:valyl-tRNA synthetase